MVNQQQVQFFSALFQALNTKLDTYEARYLQLKLWGYLKGELAVAETEQLITELNTLLERNQDSLITKEHLTLSFPAEQADAFIMAVKNDLSTLSFSDIEGALEEDFRALKNNTLESVAPILEKMNIALTLGAYEQSLPMMIPYLYTISNFFTREENQQIKQKIADLVHLSFAQETTKGVGQYYTAFFHEKRFWQDNEHNYSHEPQNKPYDKAMMYDDYQQAAERHVELALVRLGCAYYDNDPMLALDSNFTSLSDKQVAITFRYRKANQFFERCQPTNNKAASYLGLIAETCIVSENAGGQRAKNHYLRGHAYALLGRLFENGGQCLQDGHMVPDLPVDINQAKEFYRAAYFMNRAHNPATWVLYKNQFIAPKPVVTTSRQPKNTPLSFSDIAQMTTTDTKSNTCSMRLFKQKNITNNANYYQTKLNRPGVTVNDLVDCYQVAQQKLQTRHFHEAAQLFYCLAEYQHPLALLELANLLDKGLGVTANPSLAYYLMVLAQELTEGKSEHALGEAAFFIAKSLDIDIAPHQTVVGCHKENDEYQRLTLEYYRKAAFASENNIVFLDLNELANDHRYLTGKLQSFESYFYSHGLLPIDPSQFQDEIFSATEAATTGYGASA